MRTTACIISVAAAILLGGCSAAKRPVLYPNAYYNQVGGDQAERDIDYCLHLAEQSGANSGKGAELTRKTAKAGAVGGATGAVVGAISSSSDIARGAGIGAAGAATATLVGGAFDAAEPTDIYIRFVDQCLRERGYQPLGWR